MLNRNFANAHLALHSATSGGAKPRLTDMNNNNFQSYLAAPTVLYDITNIRAIKTVTEAHYTTFAIGSGKTKETYLDFALETPIDITDFSIVPNSAVRTVDDTITDAKTIISQVWQYNGTNQITINEIGLVSGVMYENALYSYHTVMFDRTVLESPITLSGASAENPIQFTISLTIGGKATVTVNS